MKIRPSATFTSDLPDDHIENEEEVLQYGGKNVIEAIGAILAGLGCTVDPPFYEDEQESWELHFWFEKRPLWCQVAPIEDHMLLHVGDRTLGSGFLGRYHPAYLDALKRLAQELANDRRFHDVLWFRTEDVYSGVPGSKTPL